MFATGRHLDSVREFYRALDTDRRAAACICMEGTEVWLLRGRRYRLDDGWPQVIGAHWDRAAVVNAAEAAGRLILQHDQWQSEYKVSWFVEGDDPAAVVERVRGVLVARGLRARAVFSGRHLLDLIPSNAGQGSAAGFVARRLGIRAESVVTAGGSGSDLDMMRPGLGFKSIVVGNAEPELRDLRGDEIYQATQRRADGIAEGLQHFGWLGAV